MIIIFLKEDFLDFLCTLCNTALSVSEDAGIQPSARSHPQIGYISSTLGWISSTTWLDLIHNLARSNLQFG